MGLARRLARQGADGKIALILSKTGRSDRQIAQGAAEKIETEGFTLLPAAWGLRDGLQSEFDHGGTGLEASNHYLREIAEATSAAMLKRVFG